MGKANDLYSLWIAPHMYIIACGCHMPECQTSEPRLGSHGLDQWPHPPRRVLPMEIAAKLRGASNLSKREHGAAHFCAAAAVVRRA